MQNNKVLSEEKYQKTSKILTIIGALIIIVGIIASSYILVSNLNIKSNTNKEDLNKKLNKLKLDLEQKRDELEAKGIIESSNYREEEAHNLFLINIALRPDLKKCENFSSYYDNDITREYCEVKAKMADSNKNKIIDLFVIAPALMILMPCLAIGAMIIMFSKQRSINAFIVQSGMPIAQEGIEEIAPSMGKAAKEITKGIKAAKDEDNK